MRYAYAITGALLLGGAAATMTLQQPLGAQTAQNEPGAINAVAPKPGAPMSFADMVEKLQPAVVNISTTQHIKVPQQANPFAGTPFEDMFQQFGGGGGGAPVTREGESLGSGFLISPDGYVVTNDHVISPGTQGATVDTITVTLTDRKEYKARVIGHDQASDLAVLKIDGKNLPFVRFGDSKSARVGDWIVAIGQPFGIGSSVTAGIISALHRVTGLGQYSRFIQTDAAINRGNSGGPMFDMQGQVIGINSQILSPTGGNVGIGFAIPAEEAKPVIETLMKGESVKRGYLGVGPQPLSDDIAAALGLPKNHGEILRQVEPNSAAAKAGLKVGDVVVKVNGKDVTPDETLSYMVADQPPGARVPFEIIRDGKRMTLTATLGTRPPEDELQAQFNPDADDAMPDSGESTDQATADSIGLSVVPLTPTIARQVGVDAATRGVVVSSADPSFDAGQKLRRGDVIISANGAQVTNAAEFAGAVAAAQRAGRNQVLLFVQRGRNPGQFLAVKIKQS